MWKSKPYDHNILYLSLFFFQEWQQHPGVPPCSICWADFLSIFYLCFLFSFCFILSEAESNDCQFHSKILEKIFPSQSLDYSIKVASASFAALSTPTVTSLSHLYTCLFIVFIWIYLYWMLEITNDLFTLLFSRQCPHQSGTSKKNHCIWILCAILWYKQQTQILCVLNNCIIAITKENEQDKCLWRSIIPQPFKSSVDGRSLLLKWSP